MTGSTFEIRYKSIFQKIVSKALKQTFNSDGISLNSVSHPSTKKLPKRHKISNDYLEQVEIELPDTYQEKPMTTRIYAVTDHVNSTTYLIEASSQAVAINHLTHQQFTAKVPTNMDLVNLLKAGIEIEKAAASDEKKGKTGEA